MCDFINNYKDKIVVVTGASGYIASVLIDELKKSCASVICVSRSDLLPVPGVLSLKLDICSEYSWKDIVSKADVIFHLAGNTSVYNAAKNPAESLRSTVLPINHLIAEAQRIGRKPRVVFASTATVYGLTNKCPVSEKLLPNPITNYDLHKLFAEKQLALASKQSILEGVSLRLSNVYGPSANISSCEDRGILNKIIRLALEGGNLQLYGGGDYLRDYLYIDDVVRAFMIAGAKKKVTGRSFNVASGKSTTIKDVFSLVSKRVENITNNQVDILNVPWPVDADMIELRNFVADNTNFSEITGWRPLVDLSEGIDRMISFFLDRFV